MEVICIEEKAFYVLVQKVIKFAKDNQQKLALISQEEAMKLLGIKSKSTLQKLRDHGQIRFSQPMRKVIQYDKTSIDFLNRNAREVFGSMLFRNSPELSLNSQKGGRSGLKALAFKSRKRSLQSSGAKGG